MSKLDPAKKENRFTLIQGGGAVAIAAMLGVMASAVLGGGSAALAPRVPVAAHSETAANGVVVSGGLKSASATQLSHEGSTNASTPAVSGSTSHLSAAPAVSGGGAVVSPSLAAAARTAASTPTASTLQPSGVSSSPSSVSSSYGSSPARSGSVSSIRMSAARDLSAAADTSTTSTTNTTTTAAPYQIPNQLPPNAAPPSDASQPSAPTAGYVNGAPAVGSATLWGGESPLGNVTNAAQPGVDQIVHSSDGTWLQGPGGATLYLGPPGTNPKLPDYSQPSLNDIWLDLENQVKAGTLIVPAGVAEGDMIKQMVDQLMQGNPNTDNYLYYANANPNSLGYHLLWGIPF